MTDLLNESGTENDIHDAWAVYERQTQGLQFTPKLAPLFDGRFSGFALEQAIYALENGCDVLVEKTVSFTKDEVEEIMSVAKKNNQKAYCVLQVRLNPTVSLMKEILDLNLLGKIRSINFIQRWQRPLEYFTGWRSLPNVGGGTLYEVGIHYLDVIQKLFGKPSVHSSKVYSTKHTDVDIEDTIYSR